MISVIVPIYNVEKYLRRALDSILSQTYKDWEAILVDDGSTDGSSLIAEEYARNDNRFKVIHKTNGGQSDARNAGMQHINGEYLLFLDSDDFLHPQLMELCIEAIQRDNSDIVAFTYDRRYRTIGLILHFLRLGDPTPHYKYYKHPPYIVTDNIFDYATEYSHPREIDRRWAIKHCQVWRCMYKTSAVIGIPFIKGIIYEDFPWWSEVLLHIRRCTILNLPLYFYYPNPKSDILSAKHAYKIESLRQSIEAAQRIYASAPEWKRKAWESNFLVPFENKLREKN
ncbi:MAG: glycosyltransferase family 2 protein [Bacteroidaceae bacterium]|nr:glycosyltransferase family 2 protein [Bacteroidaceae bacterium]